MLFNRRHSPVLGRPQCSASWLEAGADAVLEVSSLTLCVCTSCYMYFVFCEQLKSRQRKDETVSIQHHGGGSELPRAD